MRRVVLLVLVSLLSGCFSGDAAPPAADVVDNAPEEDSTDAQQEAAPLPPLELEVLLEDMANGAYAIKPGTIELEKDRLVKLRVVNQGIEPHNLIIEGLGVTTRLLNAGESQDLEFTPTAAGTFRAYCSVGGAGPTGHAGMGMDATVVVS